MANKIDSVSNQIREENLEDAQTLSALFDEGLELYNQIGNNQKPSNSPEFQMDVKKAINIFERSTRLVSITDLFSSNEGIEEIATNDLKYFLLPALLGSLTMRITSGDRKQIVFCSEIYFKDFLKRTNDYGLSNYAFHSQDPDTSKSNTPKTELEIITTSVNVRANKIQRFNEQKELKAKLENLKKNMNNENIDDEVKRNFYLTLIKLFIHEATDELDSIEMEKPILEHMANLKDEGSSKPLKRPPAPLMPTIILTRDQVQKAVYGAGYPSLPTYTVQEFYDKRVADGIFPDPNKKKSPENMSLQEKALAGLSITDEDKEQTQEEKLVEDDDDENLARMRARDEFKDDHRRGWGNRMNRS